MPILSGVTVYRISDLPPSSRPNRAAFFEVAHDGYNYKVPLTAVSMPDDAVVVPVTPASPVDAGFGQTIVLQASATIRLPFVTADDVGKYVVVKRVYTSGPVSQVHAASTQQFFDAWLTTTDVLDAPNRSITYKAVVGGWVRT